MTDALEIVPYDPRWPAEFAAERARIAAALGALALRIDHNGSTSVPGLAAKPVIDIQVSVARLAPLEPFEVPLTGIGYSHTPHPDDSFAPFFHRPERWPHTHHVHLVEAGGLEERKTLAFRDYLREHDEAAREYAELKRGLAGRFGAGGSDSREAYANAKTDFVVRISERALAMGLPRGL
ncbi:MAG TPA: GrpB family protein [Myxococcota bacterium]|nr:GrpB family protein [Myxococcota bacterium]